jgi:excisionase family DNA binding protein
MARPAKPADPTPTAADICADGALSVESAAKLCDVSVKEIRRAIDRGELEVLYWGRLPRIPRAVVVAHLAAKLEAERAARAERAGTGART